MTEPLRITQALEPRGPAGGFFLTDEQVAAVGGGRKAFPVRVTVNGTTLRLRLARMGGENVIGLSKASRAEAGVDLGSTYDVEIALDEAERTVEVPADLAAALAPDAAAQAAFARNRAVDRQRREATRADRVAKAVEMVRSGRTR